MRWLLPAGACLAALAAADGGTDFWRTQSGACRDYSGSNVKSEPLPDIARFSACQVACMEDSLCEAVEWYREQFLGAHCHRIPPRPAYEMAHLTGETSHQPFQGGGEPYDAQCAFRIGCRDAFSHYEGFCKDFRNRDVMADPVPDAVESLEACQAACRADDGCEGVEWYPDTQGWQNHKCHKFPGTPGSGGSSSMQVVQGGGDYLDAQCYVRHCFGGVARLRNDRWQHFTGYCRDRSGTDVQGNPVNLSETLEACQSVCSEDLSCEAIVWYPETRGYGEVKCWRYPPAPGSTHSGRGDSTEMPSQGGGNYLDAQCYLRFGRDSFTHFDGFCTDRDGVDVMADAVPSAESLEACQAVCLLNESCTGIEWYPGSGGWQNHKCHKFPGTPGSGGSSSLPVVQGGEVYLDAQCYVRPHSGAAVSISVAPFLYSLSLSLSLLSANPSLQNLQGLSAWNLALHSSTAEAFHDLLGPLEEPTATSPRTDTYEQDFRNELRDAVRACDVERLGSVLDSGSSLPSARRVEILGESDGSGRTLLHLCPTWANSNNATKAVRKLLDSSANCDAVDAFGRTPLEAAIESCAQREMEDPEPVLKLCEALIPHSSTQVFLDKQTGDTAIGRAVVTLLQDHGVAVEVEGEPAPTEAVEESTVAAGRVGLQPDLSAVTMTFEDQLPAV